MPDDELSREAQRLGAEWRKTTLQNKRAQIAYPPAHVAQGGGGILGDDALNSAWRSS